MSGTMTSQTRFVRQFNQKFDSKEVIASTTEEENSFEVSFDGNMPLSILRKLSDELENMRVCDASDVLPAGMLMMYSVDWFAYSIKEIKEIISEQLLEMGYIVTFKE